jgi:hypothetical protein
MTTIKELVFRLHRKLDGGSITDDSKYTYKELLGYIRSGLKALMKTPYYEALNLDDSRYGADNVSVTTTNTISLDTVTGLKYITTTNETIAVAGNRQVNITSANPVSRYAVTYIPIRQEEVLVNRLQDQIPCVVLFYREGNRFYLFNGETKEKTVKLTERYAIPTDEDAEIVGGEDVANQVIQQAMQLLMNGQVPSDRSNDGVPNT